MHGNWPRVVVLMGAVAWAGCAGKGVADQVEPAIARDTPSSDAGAVDDAPVASEPPSAPCPAITPGACRIRVVYGDTVNTVIEVKAVSTTQLLVTDAPDTEDAWTETVDVLADGNLVMTPGVPSATCTGILAGYERRDPALGLSAVAGYSCDELGMALAYYFVSEWFYFG